jgi:integrase
MASLIPGYEYDIFISYRQKDNKGDRWVSEFVEALKTELESTFKEEISVYFDINPHDGLLETQDVDASLQDKLKCLIFIPIISRTNCDPKSFAWEHEFQAFVERTSRDQYGLKVKLPNGNVSSRVLPVRIHDLDASDIKVCESVLGTVLRGVEFIYKEPGVNKPLTGKNGQIDQVFVRKSGDDDSIAFREKCEGFKTKCERTFNKVIPFNKARFRELLEENERKVPQTLNLKDLFTDYCTNYDAIKYNTMIRYRTTGNIFETYKKGLTVSDITPDFLRKYERSQLEAKLSPVTIASYLIDVRRILNYYTKVVKVIPQTYEYPFGEGKYQIKKPKLPKSVLSNEEIKAVAELNKFDSPEEEYARDIWLLCYRYNGSNYVDMLRLKWADVKRENIIFYRKKTETTQRINKKPVNVALNDGAQSLLDKLGDKDSIFVLGLLKEGYSEKTISNRSNKDRKNLNLHLKNIEKKLNLSAPLRLGTARDCYASCLKRAEVPTQFYL